MNTSHDNSIELAWAAGFFDGINGPYLNQGKLPRYVWQTNGHKARRVMELLRPYLCSPKVLKFDAIKEVYCP
jgi:hypothetical protein